MDIEHYTDRGTGSTLIMLHGWGQTMQSMKPLADVLAKDFRVITFDFPGHGNAKDESGPYTFERYIETVQKTIVHCGVDKFHLLGWSMGGTVAAIYAMKDVAPAPESLILLASSPQFVTDKHGFLMGQAPGAVKKMERMIEADEDAGLRDFIDRFFESGEIMGEEKANKIRDIFYTENFPPKKETLLSTLSQLAKTNLTTCENAYDGSVLLINSGMDKICPVGGQKLWEKVFGNIAEKRIEKGGHAPHLTFTNEVADSIKNFILK